jgi:tRNA A37 threonylcarbamoyladenosine dehydratase
MLYTYNLIKTAKLMQTFSTLKLIYGEELAERVTKARILVVGAGGIGCEVMKTLSVTGFTQVTIVKKKEDSQIIG